MSGALAGKTVCLAFFEASTRTAVSFELAARRSGAHVISLSEKGSAISKGESLIDTVVTLDRLGADAIVLRHPAAGAAALAARHTSAPVINAGDGCGQHPTQALLDLYALSEALGGFDDSPDDASPSWATCCTAASPAASCQPSSRPAWRSPSSPPAPSCHPTTVLRPARARLRGRGARLGRGGTVHAAAPEREDDRREDTLRRRVRPVLRRLAAASGGGALVMHPGPVNRGVEISGDVVLDDSSLIPDQVAAGVSSARRSSRSRPAPPRASPRDADGRLPVDLVIRHAHVLDPATGLDGIMDVRLSSGRIAEVGEGLRGPRTLDADGLHLFPGFVDVHAHWRTPGREDEEDIETGSAAAAAGGFTSVVMMPNTDPIIDRPWWSVASSGGSSGSRGFGPTYPRPCTSGSLASGSRRCAYSSRRGRSASRTTASARLRPASSATACSTPAPPGCP